VLFNQQLITPEKVKDVFMKLRHGTLTTADLKVSTPAPPSVQ
jgi:hypothetical protein